MVPKKIVPNAISNYVAKNFPGTSIRQIEKRRRGGYQVELSNGLELKFDSSLKFVRMDD
ncbi:PepSY-like domain-containing protein [Porphyromonas endodontalis]|uniref:PepSY-like domain-containing protein n=1 Tax=Porphyromonas endodontalis TaxID=28124 RepID=UPI0028E9FE82|nr:PepSY-like domain-containing protein [Porphyromonas endodontalis]